MGTGDKNGNSKRNGQKGIEWFEAENCLYGGG
nr:MAG TPA: hypothetical protein [Caudoviricetes sp.]